MTRRSPLILAALLCACRTPQPAPPPSPVTTHTAPSPEPTLPAVSADASTADAALAADVTTDTSPDAGPPTALERLVRAVASGATPLPTAIDPARGVTVVRVLEATPDGRTPERISSRHLCGAALTHALPSLRADLVSAVRQAEQLESIACDASECLVPGMEYQPAWRIRAVAEDGGAPRITVIAQVSEATMGEAWLARVQAALTHASAAPRCPR